MENSKVTDTHVFVWKSDVRYLVERILKVEHALPGR